MQRRNWPAFLAAGGSVLSLLLAVWPGSMFDRGVERGVLNQGWWWAAHVLAGAFGIFAVLAANRYTMMSRALLAVGAVLLLSLLFTEAFAPRLLVTVILPAVLLGIGAVLITPAETHTRL